MTWSGYSEQGQGSQERGPGTFALGTARAVQGNAASGAAGGEARGGIRYVGSGTQSAGRITPGNTQAPQATSVRDDTLSILLKLGQATLAPRIAAIKQQAEVDGAVRHASGVALEEIINEQPWYANVFGTAPAVEGARAYGAAAATARFVQGNLENMEQLSQQPPEAIAPLLTAQLEQYLTGDAATDAVIKRELIGQIPTLVKSHTKAHVAYMQKKADVAHYNAMTATAEKYGAIRNQPDMLSNEDADLAQSELASIFVLPEGRNPDSHWKNVTNVLVDQATKGNSHFLAAATQVGMLEALPPDYRDVVKAGISKAAPGIFARATVGDLDLMTAVAALETNPPDTPEEIQAEWSRINGIMALRTGVPETLVRYRGAGDLMSLLELDQRRDLQAARANETAVNASMRKQQEQLQKEQDTARRQIMYTQALRAGYNDPKANLVITMRGAASVFGLTEDEAAEPLRAILNSTPPAGIGAILARSPNETHPAIKDHLATWYSAASRPEEKEALMAGWSNLLSMAQALPGGPDGEAILGVHMGTDKAAVVNHVRQLASSTDVLTAVAIATREAPARRAAAKWRAQASDEKIEDVREEVGRFVEERIGTTDNFRGMRSLTGGRKVVQQQVDALAGILMAADDGLLSAPAGRKVALQGMTANGNVTLAGGGVVWNWDTKDAVTYPLHKAAGFSSPGQDDALHEALYLAAEDELGKLGYGGTRSYMETTLGAIGKMVASPVAGLASLVTAPREVGFEATGYYITRLPRDKKSTLIQYLVTYEQDGVPKSITVDSRMARKKYDELTTAVRNNQQIGGVPIKDIGTDSLIVPSGQSN